MRGLDWFGLFLRLDGRIGRKAFWIGFSLVALALLGSDLMTRGSGAASLITLALLYPLIAVVVKRLHDRGRSGWWAGVAAAPLVVSIVAGLLARLAFLGHEAIVRAATVSLWTGVAAVAVLVVIELGLRRGDPGYSVHGPPPLA